MPKSYNGWPASKDKAAIGIDGNAVVRGTSIKFPPGLKGGDVAFVLGYVAGELHRRVEPASSPLWGYYYKQSANSASLISCHASGTAFDWNAPKHPNGKRGTFTPKQVATIKAIMAEVHGAVVWRGDVSGAIDEMHFEIAKITATVLKQKANQLRQDLVAAQNKAGTKPSAPPAWWTKDLFRGSNDDRAVRVARHNLHLELDGVNDDDWDVEIERAVRTLQKKAGLPVNGKIDAATAKAIG